VGERASYVRVVLPEASRRGLRWYRGLREARVDGEW
jgi:hypothetical protein